MSVHVMAEPPPSVLDLRSRVDHPSNNPWNQGTGASTTSLQGTPGNRGGCPVGVLAPAPASGGPVSFGADTEPKLSTCALNNTLGERKNCTTGDINGRNSSRNAENALSLAGPLGDGGLNWSKNGRKSRKKQRVDSFGAGHASLATLTAENRRKTKRHFPSRKKSRKGQRKGGSHAGATPGGLFPVTPKFVLGAPSMRNETLMNSASQLSSGIRHECISRSGERGILGITNQDTREAGAVTLGSFEAEACPASSEPLNFFGSNEGLIVLRSSPSGSTSASGDATGCSESDSEENDNLRGMELHLDEASDIQQQRLQEYRLNNQADYISQLEDDNLILRGQLIKMEEELESLRKRDEEHLNLQERLFLLEEELRRVKSGSQAEDGEIINQG
uniref:Uncharacterized protein n=1 Tax=Tetraselmis sp. GSL018 TaxID=582737 RepID=A0A061SF65_9CHLO